MLNYTLCNLRISVHVLCFLIAHTHNSFTALLEFVRDYTQVSGYQKGKTRKGITNLDLLEQEIVSDSGICWAICKSAPHPRQPRPHPSTQFFTSGMPFLPPNQQRQSTEGIGTEGMCFLVAHTVEVFSCITT